MEFLWNLIQIFLCVHFAFEELTAISRGPWKHFSSLSLLDSSEASMPCCFILFITKVLMDARKLSLWLPHFYFLFICYLETPVYLPLFVVMSHDCNVVDFLSDPYVHLSNWINPLVANFLGDSAPQMMLHPSGQNWWPQYTLDFSVFKTFSCSQKHFCWRLLLLCSGSLEYRYFCPHYSSLGWLPETGRHVEIRALSKDTFGLSQDEWTKILLDLTDRKPSEIMDRMARHLVSCLDLHLKELCFLLWDKLLLDFLRRTFLENWPTYGGFRQSDDCCLLCMNFPCLKVHHLLG